MISIVHLSYAWFKSQNLLIFLSLISNIQTYKLYLKCSYFDLECKRNQDEQAQRRAATETAAFIQVFRYNGQPHFIQKMIFEVKLRLS